MQNRTKHQDKIIRNYYQNRDEIAVQRLQELASELYLCESEKKRQQLWKQATTHLEALKIPASQIQHLVKANQPELLAKTLDQFLKK